MKTIICLCVVDVVQWISSNMVQVFDNIFTKEEIKVLLDYMSFDDGTIDARPDVKSKHPKWDQGTWPQELVKKGLDRVLEKSYHPETVIFNDSIASFRLHVDSGNGDQKSLYKNVLFPLWHQGQAATVLFNNYWLGSSTRFSRVEISPFEYNIQGRIVKDIRVLLEKCLKEPGTVTEFDITDQLIKDLQHLVEVRKMADTRTYDYSSVVNYDPDAKFDEDIRQRYLSHIPIETLHGLTVDKVIEWQPGSAIVFDRQQIHSAASGHDRKIGISVFTLQLN